MDVYRDFILEFGRDDVKLTYATGTNQCQDAGHVQCQTMKLAARTYVMIYL